MALKGLDIFKLTPKKNCKECGFPTCMAFAMKVAQGAVEISKCPYMSDDAIATLSEATAPPMKSFTFGNDLKLGGETVLYRHEKTFVSKSLFAATATPATFDAAIAAVNAVSYDRIGETMGVDVINLVADCDAAAYAEAAKKAAASGKAIVLDCKCAEAAEAALAECASAKPILNGATPENYAKMLEIAQKHDVLLGVSAPDLDALYDTVAAIEAAGYKNMVIDVTMANVKDTFEAAVQVRRAAIKNNDRTFGYPSIVNISKIAPNDAHMQTALGSIFVLKYGSIIVMDGMSYAQALPIFGLRQNIFTDPQKPMRVEPGIYPLNGADENSVCVTTVDFALTYFVVSGELERSGVPCNLIISDAGGYSVLTSWAAGKFSAGTISKYIAENDIENKVKNRTLIIPGKVAVLKGDLQEKLPGWEIVVAPNEATGLVKFMKDYK